MQGSKTNMNTNIAIIQNPSNTLANRVGITSVHKLAHLDHRKGRAGGQLDKKARSKWVSWRILRPLLDLDSELNYKSSISCSSVIVQKGKKLTSTYCNQRWCLTCNRIRTGKMINRYGPEIKEIEEKAFLTLSCTNVPKDNLREELKRLTKCFANCVRRVKRKHQVKGIRKIEVTYNKEEDTYHPHIHGIFSLEVSNALRSAWMDMQGPLSHWKGQDVRKANDDDVHELFKYATKLFKVEKDKAQKGRAVIVFDPISQDAIFTALKNQRTFQSYGMSVEVSEDISELDAEEFENLRDEDNVWRWVPKLGTWVNEDGVLLSRTNHVDVYLFVLTNPKDGS